MTGFKTNVLLFIDSNALLQLIKLQVLQSREKEKKF